MILSRGTKCGKIPRSEIAARLVLEKLKMTNSDMNLDQIERMITSNISPKVENPQK